jgi:transcriptional regulator with XRE-family HTH domain
MNTEITETIQIELSRKRISDFLKYFRAKHDVSQEYVAAKLEISQSNYSKLENSRLKLSLRQFCYICEKLEFIPHITLVPILKTNKKLDKQDELQRLIDDLLIDLK